MKNLVKCSRAKECGVAYECPHGVPHKPQPQGSSSCDLFNWGDINAACGIGTRKENPRLRVPKRHLVPMHCK